MRRIWSFVQSIASIGAAAIMIGCSSINVANAVDCPQLEIVAVENQGGRTIPGPDGSVLHIANAPLLSMPDFTGANVRRTEGQIALNVNLSHDGSNRIQAYTKAHVGAPLAFIVEGKVIRVAKILDPITGNGIMISPLKKAHARELAARINSKIEGCGLSKS